MKRKLLAMLLAAAMVFVMLPTTVAAAGSKTYKIGTGKDFTTLEAAVADATHDFELTFDDNYHWNRCTDENCSIIKGKAAHEGEYCECGVNGTGEKSAPNFFLFMFMKRLMTEYEITVETEGSGIVESDDDDNFIRFSHDVTFTAVPDEGSELTSILLDGEEVALPADDEYTIERVRKAHTITFVFSEIEQEPAE